MADVFEDGSSDLDTQRMNLWALILSTPMLDWQLLTKRPSNILRMIPIAWRVEWPPNVWVGTTAENQEWLDVRAAWMRRLRPRVLFISYEPALGPITVPPWASWVIAGGESGNNHRAMNPDWARSVRDQCVAAGIPFFFKQWGGLHPKAHGSELDGRQWKQFPL